MSAHVMEETGFQRLADELASHAENSQPVCDLNYTVAYIVRQFLGFDASAFSAPIDAHPEASLVAQELYRANVLAVNERYDETDRAVELSFVRQSYTPQWSPVQLYKALCCLSYQMSEGDVPESELYKKLSAFINEIAAAIVSHSPAYDKAVWGWGDSAKRRAA